MAGALAQAVEDMPAWLLVLLAVLALVLVVLIAIAVAQAQLQPSVVTPQIPGAIGEAVTAIDGRRGEVLVNGEYWSARRVHTDAGDQPIPPGATVRIVAVHGLRLTVEQMEAKYEA